MRLSLLEKVEKGFIYWFASATQFGNVSTLSGGSVTGLTAAFTGSVTLSGTTSTDYERHSHLAGGLEWDASGSCCPLQPNNADDEKPMIMLVLLVGWPWWFLNEGCLILHDTHDHTFC